MCGGCTQLAKIFFKLGNGCFKYLPSAIAAAHGKQQEGAGNQKSGTEQHKNEYPAFPVECKYQTDKQEDTEAKTKEGSDAKQQRPNETQALGFELVARQRNTRMHRRKQRSCSVAQGSEETPAPPRILNGCHPSGLATADQYAERQPDRRCNADSFPGMFVHEIIGCPCRCLG